MAYCVKCGMETEDGKELCDNCSVQSQQEGESYLDDLLNSIAEGSADNNDEIPLPSDEVDPSPEEEPISLDEVRSEETEEGEKKDEDISELLDLLSDHYEEENTDTSSMGDVFENALSAVSYMENEEEGSGEEKNTEPVSESITEPENILSDEVSELMEQTLAANTEESDEQGEEESFVLDELFSEEPQATEEQEDLPLDMLGEQTLEAGIPVELPEDEQTPVKDKKEKKQSFIKKIKSKYFDNIIDDEAIKKEEDEARLEEELVEQKKETKKKEKQDKEELKIKREEEKEKKKAEKEAKAAEAAQKKEEKRALKKKRREEEEKQYTGRVNPVGAAIVFLLFAAIGISSYFGTKSVSHKSYISNAELYYDTGNYAKAYDQLAGINISESEMPLYKKTRLLASLQQKVDACDEYIKMKLPLEALNSLINGVKKYDTTLDDADQLQIRKDVDMIQGEITERLKDEFKMTVEEARALSRNESRTDYTKKLQEKIAQVK